MASLTTMPGPLATATLLPKCNKHPDWPHVQLPIQVKSLQGRHYSLTCNLQDLMSGHTNCMIIISNCSVTESGQCMILYKINHLKHTRWIFITIKHSYTNKIYIVHSLYCITNKLREEISKVQSHQ